MFERLDTTPGQERAIRDEFETLRDKAHDIEGAFRQSGSDLAQAIRGDAFDREMAGAGMSVQDEALRQLRDAVMDSLARVHEVLDTRQRGILADILQDGPPRRGGPYRGWM